MTLDEAIQHCDDVIQEKLKQAHVSMEPESNQECVKCAEEHKQLKQWLENYKQLKMFYDLCFFEDVENEEDNYFNNLKETFEDYCFIEDEKLNKKAIPLKRGLEKFTKWIRENYSNKEESYLHDLSKEELIAYIKKLQEHNKKLDKGLDNSY